MLLSDRKRRWQFLPAEDTDDDTDHRIVPDDAVLRSDGTIAVLSGHRVTVPMMMMDTKPKPGGDTMTDEQALAARRQMLADAATESLAAFRQAMRDDEARRRDPATPYGAYCARLANAWKDAGR